MQYFVCICIFMGRRIKALVRFAKQYVIHTHIHTEAPRYIECPLGSSVSSRFIRKKSPSKETQQ